MRFVYKQFSAFQIKIEMSVSIFRHTTIESTRTLHENSEVTTKSTGGTVSCVCNN